MCEIERDPKVHDVLRSHADDYEVRGELHRVPPHVTYEVEIEGTRAVCKLATRTEGDPATEARIYQHLERETSIPVPRVLAAGEGYYLAAWHDDVPQETPQMDESLARTLGAGLATLHDETTFDSPGFLQADEDGLELDACETWHETVRAFLADLHSWLEPYGHADVAASVLEFVDERPDLFAGFGEPVLCHGNFVPDHVGIDGGELACVIDFEHAIVGPGEYDYWRTAIPTFHGDDEANAAAFREGYESIRALPEGFDDRRERYWTLNMVSYLKALHLQRQMTGEEAERRAEGFRKYAFETLDSLRSERK